MISKIFNFLKIIHKRSLEEKKYSFENNDIFNSLNPFFTAFLYRRISKIKIENDIKNTFDINGDILFFSSARMSLNFILSNLKAKNREYVVVQAFTCGVVINAIIRAGFRPLYVDIDKNNLGTSFEDFRNLYKTYNTSIRAVIVQHSFGIPASINKFVEFSREKNIFVIEDCATSLGSKLNEKTCGNFGDAAFWSFDPTKPFSIGTGGVLSINNTNLFNNLKTIYLELPTQTNKEFFFFSVRYLTRQLAHKLIVYSYPRKLFIELSETFLSKFLSFSGYSEDWNYSNKYPKNYSYPSKLNPLFIYSLHRSLKYFKKIQRNKINLFELIKKKYYSNLNLAFKNRLDCELIPSRILLNKEDNSYIEKYVNQNKAWFREPLQGIDPNTGDQSIRYKKGIAPLSENLTMKTYSIPMNNKFFLKLISRN